jgi:hypothetical protein
MIAGQTIQNLAKKVADQHGRKRDFLIDTREVKMLAEGGRMTMNLNKGALEFAPRTHMHRQIGERLGIPSPYYNRMLSEAPDLLAANANRWLQKDPETRLLRLVTEGKATAGRAFLSDRYRRLDNYDLMEHIVPKIVKSGAKITSSEVTETNLYIHAIFPKLEREIKKGDVVQSGLVVRNSEVGKGTLQVQPLVYRLVCLNGLILPDASLRKYHIGGKNEADGEELFRNETLVAMDKTFWMQVEDVVDSVLTETVFAAAVEKLKDASEVKIKKPQAAVELTAKHFGISKDETESVMRNLIEGADLSQYGMVNAFTAVANDLKDYDRGVEFEEMGGKILELPQTFWKN